MNILQLLLDQQRKQWGGQGMPLLGPLGDLLAPVQRTLGLG